MRPRKTEKLLGRAKNAELVHDGSIFAFEVGQEKNIDPSNAVSFGK